MIKELNEFLNVINPIMFSACTCIWLMTVYRVKKYINFEMDALDHKGNLLLERLNALEFQVYSHPLFEDCGHWMANQIKAGKERMKEK